MSNQENHRKGMPLGGATAPAKACQIKKSSGRGCLSAGQWLKPRHVKSRKPLEGDASRRGNGSSLGMSNQEKLQKECLSADQGFSKSKMSTTSAAFRQMWWKKTNLTGISQMFAALPILQGYPRCSQLFQPYSDAPNVRSSSNFSSATPGSYPLLVKTPMSSSFR